MTEFDIICAYCAGIMDGEGHFGICIQRPTPNNRRKFVFHCARVTCVNTSLKILRVIVDNFGGKIQKRTKIEGRKQTYHVALHSDKMVFFCKSILPYLRHKKRQAEIIIDFHKTVSYPRFSITPEERERRQELYLEISRLNKTGDE